MGTINGTNGDDLIDESGETDKVKIKGKDGNDTLIGGSGDDDIDGGDGNDDITGNDGDDKLDGGDGDDTIDGGDGEDDIKGGKGKDTVLGGRGDDKIKGEDGDDILDGGEGDDEIDGGKGDDVIAGGDGNDEIDGDKGDDTIDGGDGDDEIEGGDGDDLIMGGDGDDEIDGDKGDDTIEGGAGDDTIDGGKDTDTVVYSGSILDFSFASASDDDDDDFDEFFVTDENTADGDQGTDLLEDVEILQFDDFTIDLTGGNNAPLVAAQPQSTGENSALGFAIPVYDFDGDTAVLTAFSITGGGTLTQTGAPTSIPSPLGAGLEFGFNFDPGTAYDYLAVGEEAVETVSVTFDDGQGGVTTKTFDLTITGENDTPTANDDTAATDEDTAIAIAGAALVGNDTDPDTSDVLSVQSTDAVSAQGATINDNGDGTFTYDPGTLFNGLAVGEAVTDTFTYTVTDGNGGTDTATVTVTIEGVNDTPTANDDTASTDEDSSVITGSVLLNDTDPDNSDVLSVQSADATSANGASVTNNGDGTFTYDPGTLFNSLAVGESVTDTFTYTVTDGNGGTDTATVTVTIDGVNDTPTANDDTAATDEDTAIAIAGAALVGNDTDPDTSDVLSVQSTDAVSAQGATIADNGDGTFTYDPGTLFNSLAVGESVTDTFTYTVTDGNGGTDTATVTVTIDGVNDAPTATDDTASTDEDTAVTTGSVLVNDNDPDNSDVLSVLSADATSTKGATVTNNADGTFTYDPGTLFDGLAVGESDTDTFTYTVTDGNGGTDTATVTVTINGANDAPTANDDGGVGFTTDEDTFFTTGNALANDSDPDGDTLLVDGVDLTGTQGAVADNGNGSFEYDPNGQFDYLGAGDTATDSFTYTITDTSGATDTATVTITIEGVNDTPSANVATVETFEDSEEAFIDLSTLVSDPDAGDILSISNVSLVAGGAVSSIDVSGSVVSFDLAGFDSLSVGDVESFQIQYTVTDDSGAPNDSATETLTVNINGENDRPVAENVGGYSADEVNSQAFIVDLNDLTSDIDANDTLRFELLSLQQLTPAGDAAASRFIVPHTLDEEGVLTIDAAQFGLDAGENANFIVRYAVIDDSGAENDTAIGEITVNVTGDVGDGAPPDNEMPVAPDISEESDDETPISIDLLAGVTDADPGDVLSIVPGSVVIESEGREAIVFSVSAAGVLTLDPTQFGLADGETLNVTGSYSVMDDSGEINDTDSGVISIAIIGVPTPILNNQPVAQDDTLNVTEDALVTVDLRTLVSDVDGDTLTISSFAFGDENGEVAADFTIKDTGAVYEVTFDPAQFGAADGETIAITLGYTVDDGTGAPNSTNNGAVTLNITGTTENAAPIAANQSFDYSAAATPAINLDLDDFVSDPDGDPVSVVSIELRVGGVPTATQPILSGGNFVSNINFAQFSLGEDATETAVLYYEISDGNGGTDTGELTFNLTGNSAPTAAPDTVTYNLDTQTGSIVFDLNSLVGDVDPGDAGSLAITIEDFNFGGADGATPVMFSNSGGTITIDPSQFTVADGEELTATLNYLVDDGAGQFNSQAFNTVSVVISNPLDDPNITLDFEEFSFAGDSGGVSGSKGFVFGGGATVFETDELPLVGGGGRGDPPRVVEQGLLNGQTTDPGDNVLLVGTGDENQPFSINGIGATVTGLNDPRPLEDFGTSFDLQSVSLNGAYNDDMEITVTAYRAAGGPGTFVLVEVDSFVFTNIDASTAATVIDFTTFTGSYDDPLTSEVETYAFENIVKVEFEVTNPGVSAGVGGPGDEIVLDDVMIII